MEILVRHPRVADEAPCVALAALGVGEAAARVLVRAHFREHGMVVAEAAGDIVGLLAWRSDWFGCSFVNLVFVREEFRRRGIAREMVRAVEFQSRSPRLFSSVGEDDTAAIRMHTALGFRPSGHVDNLPQKGRELFFYKRIPPREAPGTPPPL